MARFPVTRKAATQWRTGSPGKFASRGSRAAAGKFVGQAGCGDEAEAELQAKPCPRHGQAAIRLPHNNTILIAGGTSNGQAISQTETYIPWRHAFQSAGDMANGRADVLPTGRDRAE